jgi:hypothetical protein
MADLATELKALLHAVTQDVVEKVLPLAASVVPGIFGPLAQSAAGNANVQAAIEEALDKGEDMAVDELVKLGAQLRDFITSHVHGALGDFLKAELAKPLPDISLTAEQLQDIAALVAAGKLSEALKQAVVDLLPPPVSA